jgi:hypothetical protein
MELTEEMKAGLKEAQAKLYEIGQAELKQGNAISYGERDSFKWFSPSDHPRGVFPQVSKLLVWSTAKFTPRKIRCYYCELDGSVIRYD